MKLRCFYILYIYVQNKHNDIKTYLFPNSLSYKKLLTPYLTGLFLEMEKFAGIKYREYDIIKCNTLQVDKNVNRR